MRNVSMDSPFEPKNLPPAGHLRPDSILEKPCKINMLKVPPNTKPLAGRLTEIGKQILEKGTKEAKLICTGTPSASFRASRSARERAAPPGGARR